METALPTSCRELPIPSRSRNLHRVEGGQPRKRRRMEQSHPFGRFITAVASTGVLALRRDFAANIPWLTVAGCALLAVSVGGAVSSAMRAGELYADTLARSSWPGKHESR